MNFEVRAYLTSQNTNNSKNILCRKRNSLVTALNKHSVLPKVITVVLDDDMINHVVDDDKVDLEFHYERLLIGLCNLLNKTLDCYKDMLLLKAKRENVPHILWIAPPNHCYFSDDNNMRWELFGKALGAAVSSQKNMTVLRMIKFWDKDNTNLFLDQQYQYTSEGLSIYWRAVDSAIRFWNVALSRKIKKPKPKKSAAKNDGILNQRAGKGNLSLGKSLGPIITEDPGKLLWILTLDFKEISTNGTILIIPEIDGVYQLHRKNI